MKTSSLFEKSAFVYFVTCLFFSTRNLFTVKAPSSIWELVLPIKIYLLILPALFLFTLWIYRSNYSLRFRKLISGVFVAHILGIYTDFYLLIFTNHPWQFFSNIYQCFIFEWDNPENWWPILFFVVPSIVALWAAVWLVAPVFIMPLVRVIIRRIKQPEVRGDCMKKGDHKDFALKFENEPSSMGLIEADTEDNTKMEKESNPIGNNSGDKVGDNDRGSEVHKKDDMKNNNSNKYIFRQHLEDLRNIEKMLHYTHILGLNAYWGDGKSFVMDEFCRKAEEDKSFYTIRIELLSYRYNEFEKVLLHKLTGLLKYCHIFSIQLEEYRAVLGKNWWGRLVGTFFLGLTDEKQAIWGSMSKVLTGLPRNVLIVYEDLERIDNIEYIKRILSISEKLMSADKSNVYVIYEYDKRALLTKSGLSPDYIEKFIPHEVNLSHVSFYSMIDQVLFYMRVDKPDWVKEEDMESLEDTKNLVEDAQVWNRYLLSLDPFDMESDIDSITPRRIIHFLQGVTENIHLIKDKFHGKWEEKKQLVNTEFQLEKRLIKAFCFVKHFMPEEYMKLKAGKNILKQPLFSAMKLKEVNQGDGKSERRIISQSYYDMTHDSNGSVKEDMVEKAKKSINSSLENRRVYSMLLMFEFMNDFEMLGHPDEYDSMGNPLHPWFGMSEYMRHLFVEERNAFINQFIWHLLQNGIESRSGAVEIFDYFKKNIMDDANEQKRKSGWFGLQGIMMDSQDLICPNTIYASNKLENSWSIIALGLLVLEGIEKEWLLEGTDEQRYLIENNKVSGMENKWLFRSLTNINSFITHQINKEKQIKEFKYMSAAESRLTFINENKRLPLKGAEWITLLNLFNFLAGPGTEKFNADEFIGFISFIDARYPNVYKAYMIEFNEIYHQDKKSGLNRVEEERLIYFAIRYISLLPYLVPELIEHSGEQFFTNLWNTVTGDDRRNYLEQEVITPLIKQIDEIKTKDTSDGKGNEDMNMAVDFLRNLEQLLGAYKKD